jgi:hypothetical protein
LPFFFSVPPHISHRDLDYHAPLDGVFTLRYRHSRTLSKSPTNTTTLSPNV